MNFDLLHASELTLVRDGAGVLAERQIRYDHRDFAKAEAAVKTANSCRKYGINSTTL
jgi:hypothetical protein